MYREPGSLQKFLSMQLVCTPAERNINSCTQGTVSLSQQRLEEGASEI